MLPPKVPEVLLLLCLACTRANPAYRPPEGPPEPEEDAAQIAPALTVDAAPPPEAPPAPPDAALAPDAPPLPLTVTFSEPGTSPPIKPANPGGSPFGDSCGGGRALVGLIGTSGYPEIVGLDSLQARCAELVLTQGPGVGTRAATSLGTRGTIGGNRHDGTCPPDQVVVGFEAATGQWIDRIYVSCARLTVRQEGGAYTVSAEAGTRLEVPIGPPAASGFTVSPCPAGKIAVGIEGSSGYAIDWLALRCARPGLR